jgi:hypothetical protein
MAKSAAAGLHQVPQPESLYDLALEAYYDPPEPSGNRARRSNAALRDACWWLDFDTMRAASSNASDTKDVANTVDFLLTHAHW